MKLSISRFSRYATYAVKHPGLRDERLTVDALLTIGHRLGLDGWVLYATRDETVAALSRNRALLADYFRVPTPEWSTIKWAWDKRNTYSLAQELEIPVPRTWHSLGVDQLGELDVDFPVAIKPAIKEHFIYATKAKAWRANNRAELEELFVRAAKHIGEAEVLIQEIIPGDAGQQFAYCAFFKQGHAITSMVVRRTRQHPREFGRASTFVETIELPELEMLSERFLNAIDYYGLVEVEYKLDLRDGQFKLLDVNARTWGYHALGRPAGVDFPNMLFTDQIGEPVEQQRGQPGISWVRLMTDFPTGIAEILGGHLNWRAYLHSLRTAHVDAVFSYEDPLPGVIELALFPYLCVRRGY